MFFRYLIAGWDIKDGEQTDNVELAVMAEDEAVALEKASLMARREYYQTMTVEEVFAPPVEGSDGGEDPEEGADPARA